jgi:serine/threonine-protein kinase RsbW
MSEPTIHRLDLVTPPADIDTVHDLLQTVWADTPSISMTDRMRFETALIELTANVIQHADSGNGVECTLTVETSTEELVATLSDSGEPVNLQLAGREMPDELSEGGRGIALIQALVDDLSYDREDGLNHWRLRHSTHSL